MQRWVIIPVGTSIRETARCWRNLPSKVKDAASWADVLAQPNKLLHPYREAVALLGWDKFTPGRIAEEFELGCWTTPFLRRLPAELASLKLIDQQLEDEASGGGVATSHLKLLYGSDSPRCAEVLSSILGCLQWGSGGSPSIELVPVDDLDATRADRFVKGCDNLAHWLETIPRGTDLVFNLTGGYKGVGILLGIASYRFAAKQFRTRRFYLFEGGDAAVEIADPPGPRPADSGLALPASRVIVPSR